MIPQSRIDYPATGGGPVRPIFLRPLARQPIRPISSRAWQFIAIISLLAWILMSAIAYQEHKEKVRYKQSLDYFIDHPTELLRLAP